jgi:hypothetical protein
VTIWSFGSVEWALLGTGYLHLCVYEGFTGNGGAMRTGRGHLGAFSVQHSHVHRGAMELVD